jgi:hypothetical protein
METKKKKSRLQLPVVLSVVVLAGAAAYGCSGSQPNECDTANGGGGQGGAGGSCNEGGEGGAVE